MFFQPFQNMIPPFYVARHGIAQFLWHADLRFPPHAVGKLSQLAIPCPRRGEAFAPCDSVPTLWGSFRRLAIPCPRRGEAFAPCDSVPTLWGSFRNLRFRAHAVGKLSSFGISCPRCREAFARLRLTPHACPHGSGIRWAACRTLS